MRKTYASWAGRLTSSLTATKCCLYPQLPEALITFPLQAFQIETCLTGSSLRGRLVGAMTPGADLDSAVQDARVRSKRDRDSDGLSYLVFGALLILWGAKGYMEAKL